MRVIAQAVHLIFLVFVPCLCPQTFMFHACKPLRSHTKTARTVFFRRYPVFSFFFEYLYFSNILAPADEGLVVGKTSPLEKIHLSMFSMVITTSKNHLLLLLQMRQVLKDCLDQEDEAKDAEYIRKAMEANCIFFEENTRL